MAKSIAATSGGSGSSGSGGKRSAKDVKSTPSTRVTPEAKIPCTSGDMVEPRSLDFEQQSAGRVCECVCVCLYMVICIWILMFGS